jgi:predicted kinase
VGKSAIARRYVEDQRLVLLLEIDELRMAMGGWQEHPESRLLARDLAMVLAEAHLRTGHDVVVPQYLGQTESIIALADLAQRVGAELIEVLLRDDEASVLARFQARRYALDEAGQGHPEADVDDADVPAFIAEAMARLRTIASQRPHTLVVTVGESVESGYLALRRALRSHGDVAER